jgi:hypothetical protein
MVYWVKSSTWPQANLYISKCDNISYQSHSTLATFRVCLEINVDTFRYPYIVPYDSDGGKLSMNLTE